MRTRIFGEVFRQGLVRCVIFASAYKQLFSKQEVAHACTFMVEVTRNKVRREENGKRELLEFCAMTIVVLGPNWSGAYNRGQVRDLAIHHLPIFKLTFMAYPIPIIVPPIAHRDFCSFDIDRIR
mmetsp:Transcript_9168/g.20250  ORF Transcript_9168/g.20250 Transcript_9168/m.20250 type:complete len:124 (-) Transcript_9168:141-512(-)